MNSSVFSIHLEANKWKCVLSNGQLFSEADHLISTAPIGTLLKQLSPKLPETVDLSNYEYRDFLTVVLMFKKEETIPDNWLYVHDDRVKVARIQIYKNWSPEMVPSKEYSSYGLEYFCQMNDDFWNKSDIELFENAVKEIKLLGLPFIDTELSFKIIRVPKAYPVYDQNYKERVSCLKRELKNYPGLHLVGRNGMHRYNNQDHSIMTAMLVVKNIDENSKKYNPWKVNQDAEYIEKGVSPDV